MSEPFIGEIRTVGFNFAPLGWALCDGQLLPISQNTALFSLLGTYYGGDGRTTFALPDLNGAFLVGAGQGPGLSSRDLGELGGERAVSLLPTEMPVHTHSARATTATATTGQASNGVWAEPRLGRASRPAYVEANPDVAMTPAALAPAGGGQPHDNMPPYLGMYFVIALQGIYPPRS